MTIRLAIPSKGRLHDPTMQLLEDAGIHIQGAPKRQLIAGEAEDRVEALFTRAKDIPEFVAHGAADAGVSGHDIVAESGADVEELVDLGYGSCELVVAAPEGWDDGYEDGMRVATSFPELTRQHFDEAGVDVEVVTVSGAAEATPHIGVADLIVDLTSTGTTLARNRLEVVETILSSTARLVCRPDAVDEVEELAFAVESVVRARDKKYLMADIPEAVLDDVAELLPGLEGPTVVPISKPDWVAIQVVVDAAEVYEKIHALEKLGARGILVTPIERLVP